MVFSFFSAERKFAPGFLFFPFFSPPLSSIDLHFPDAPVLPALLQLLFLSLLGFI